jgi:two-component system, probable response regulator PhcQ
MNTKKTILYVDDESMALKYFERLVGAQYTVMTAESVDAGIEMLKLHASSISVLVCDQRMPGAYGNELLRHTREYYPHIVRVLTTAYSEIDDAVAAINSGEIYRYITKPWGADALRADLKNAFELADLKAERDTLMQAKLSVQQGQWLSCRVGQLSLALRSAFGSAGDYALAGYLDAVAEQGGAVLAMDWHRFDLADWVQSETQRHQQLIVYVQQWHNQWREHWGGVNADSAAQLKTTANLLAASTQIPKHILQSAGGGSALAASDCEYLAYQVWCEMVSQQAASASNATPTTVSPAPLRGDWLAVGIENLMRVQMEQMMAQAHGG